MYNSRCLILQKLCSWCLSSLGFYALYGVGTHLKIYATKIKKTRFMHVYAGILFTEPPAVFLDISVQFVGNQAVVCTKQDMFVRMLFLSRIAYAMHVYVWLTTLSLILLWCCCLEAIV